MRTSQRIRENLAAAIAVVFAVPARPGASREPWRYRRTLAGGWRFLREQILPTYLPGGHWLDQDVTPERVLRRAAHWRTVSWIAAIVMLAGVSLGGLFIPAIACGVLLLAIGERGECLGWITGYTHQARQTEAETAGGAW
jgi:hypothetical protein